MSSMRNFMGGVQMIVMGLSCIVLVALIVGALMLLWYNASNDT